jgi:hypothetical protein
MFVGILILILCRAQVYVLTNIFILVFFQFFFQFLALAAYVFLMFTPNTRCKSRYYGECHESKILLLINIGLVIILITLCVTIYNLVIIINGRKPPAIPSTGDYSLHQLTITENI